jgi:hypothetical protein
LSILHDYLSRPGFSPADWETERKARLREITERRGRPALVYAARMAMPPGLALPVDLNFADLLPFYDLMSTLQGTSVDVILETPGGDGVVARDMVEMLHDRFEHVAFIVPGWAKSAGTIMTMGGHEILMGPTSALGPIDAQLGFEGKRFSAEALLEGMREIEKEVVANGRLNAALIPMLQRISPGDLQNARNAMDFARVTVTEWLSKHKFKYWTEHRTTNPGTPVTDEDRETRAREIAAELSKHQKWKSHGRSLRLADLRAMRLEIVDYSQDPALFDPIQRYYVMLRFYLDNSDAYKVIETVDAQVIQRFVLPQQAPAQGAVPAQTATSATAAIRCNTCGNVLTIQVNFVPGQPLAAGAIAYPSSEEVTCRCGKAVDLRPLRAQVEREFGRPILVGG